ncbi:MAG: hypothetical protein UT11_C0040G0004 [Berkelbacteria bacterium GW2011_GWA2_38_9]|uniref:Uncharacterized protein n=1 Tax=Berkelbacteria bacterium GW2011_GWA2_38_9 TaxID=1618334 RepID=A0A0G0LAT0_9BACT|nr:MAG: hypothetical protein UT11_C0040G0004 [Berkelbacteria bacterium GW2011_GWA2_38_9]
MDYSDPSSVIPVKTGIQTLSPQKLETKIKDLKILTP